MISRNVFEVIDELTLFKLENNLKIQLVPIPEGRTALFAMGFYAGALYEKGFGQGSTDGISHLVEHMFFKGTPKLTTKQVNEEFSKLGADLNAYTSYDHTVYYAKVPSRHLERASELWKDLLTNKKIDTSEFNAEKQVVLQEIQLYDDMPDYKASTKAREEHFKGTPLEHSILGTIDSVKSITKDMLQEYSTNYYTFDNAILTIVGGFDLEKQERNLRALFSDSINSPRNSPLFHPPITLRTPKNSKITYFNESKQLPLTYVTLNWDMPGTNNPLFFPLLVLNTFIGNSRTSLLYREVISKGLTSTCRYGFEPFFDVSSSSIMFVSSPEKTKMIFERILDLLIQVYEMRVTSDLVKRIQNEIWGDYQTEIEDPANYGIDLTQKYFKLRKSFPANVFLTQLNSISTDDVQKAKDQALEELNLTVYATGNIPKDWEPSFPATAPW